MGINIALDGPSGAGKSTYAKALAKKRAYVYVDTGALYRATALFLTESGVDVKNAAQHTAEIQEALAGADVTLAYRDGAQRVLVNGRDVSELIRTPEISMGASAVSALPCVREFLFDLQKKIAAENDILMDGRDIGTVVLPHAQVKIFLTADPAERAKRRFLELSAKGDSSTYEEVLADILQRDYNDTHREIAPLKKADDAVEVDTTGMGVEEAVEKLDRIITERLTAGEKKT
ncbi:MAG: (d)CMP kinase [Oscillospiraceae bacterium]